MLFTNRQSRVYCCKQDTHKGSVKLLKRVARRREERFWKKDQ